MIHLEISVLVRYAAITFKNFYNLLFKKSYLIVSFSHRSMTIIVCGFDSNKERKYALITEV